MGLEKDGVFHRDFELRPALIKDSIEVANEHEPAKLTNRWFANICLTCKQLVRIGRISPVPLDEFVGMFDADLKVIHEAQEKLAARLDSFHDAGAAGRTEAPADIPGEAGQQSQDGPGAAQVEVPAARGA